MIELETVDRLTEQAALDCNQDISVQETFYNDAACSFGLEVRKVRASAFIPVESVNVNPDIC
jgi:hypothetical protein